MALDSKVITATPDGKSVVSHHEPDDMPETPTFKLKGTPVVEGKRFTRAGGVVTWTPPISIYCPVEVWDGGSKVWQWTAWGGEV